MGGESSKVKAARIAQEQADLEELKKAHDERQKEEIAREKRQEEERAEEKRRKAICGGWTCDYLLELEPFIPIAREIVKKTKTYSALPVSGSTIVELALAYKENSQAKLLVEGFDLTVMIIATILYSCSKGKHYGTIIVGNIPPYIYIHRNLAPAKKIGELWITPNRDDEKHKEFLTNGYHHPLSLFLDSENISAKVLQESYPLYDNVYNRLQIDFEVKSSGAPPMYRE